MENHFYFLEKNGLRKIFPKQWVKCQNLEVKEKINSTYLFNKLKKEED